MKLTSRYFETLLCALYNNGANAFGSIKSIEHLAVNTATLLKNKKDKEKYANYLVVPNNCILSLSLSLSLSHIYRLSLISFLIFLYVYAMRAVQTMVNKGLHKVSFVLFVCPFVDVYERQMGEVIIFINSK